MAGKGSVVLKKEEREAIEKMLEHGQKVGTIAQALERSHSCVKKEITKNGGRGLYRAEAAQEAYAARVRARLMKLSHLYTEKEKKGIMELIERGASINQMAENLGMSRTSISKFIRVNNLSYKRAHLAGMNQRMHEVETQLEVLLEIVNELADKGKK